MLVQHHFVTKAGLIKAVDDYVWDLTHGDVEADSGAARGFGRRGRKPNDGDHRRAARYWGLYGPCPRDGSPLGTTIFDTLMTFGKARWYERAERGEIRSDVDLTWAAMNSLVLALGTISPALAHRPASARAADHARSCPLAMACRRRRIAA